QEKLALQDLAIQMVDHPADVLPHLVDLAIEICGGVSGGISLFEELPAPGVSLAPPSWRSGAIYRGNHATKFQPLRSNA
ncbi:MAG: hypothetical protein Q7V40_14280, partial [Pseudolabrys sp.]|nr:hypothetical protein [Pseudolabrys sp.]